jgi:hypothetical protein
MVTLIPAHVNKNQSALYLPSSAGMTVGSWRRGFRFWNSRESHVSLVLRALGCADRGNPHRLSVLSELLEYAREHRQGRSSK